MALNYHPSAGTILRCDFSGFVIPEMIKTRPVVIVSPRLRERRGLSTIIPLSTTPPRDAFPYHCLIRLSRPLSTGFPETDIWAKCDMITTVSHHRLDRFSERVTDKRRYYDVKLTDSDLERIRKSMRAYLEFTC